MPRLPNEPICILKYTDNNRELHIYKISKNNIWYEIRYIQSPVNEILSISNGITKSKMSDGWRSEVSAKLPIVTGYFEYKTEYGVELYTIQRGLEVGIIPINFANMTNGCDGGLEITLYNPI